MKNTTTPNPAAYEDALNECRLKLVMSQVASVRWHMLICVLVIAWVCWDEAPKAALVAWVVIITLIREYRALVMETVIADRAIPMRVKLRQAAIWNAVLGFSIGTIAFLMPFLNIGHDAFLTMIMVSWSAAATSTIGPLVLSYALFAGGLMLPTGAMWAIEGTPMGLGLGVLCLLAYAVQCRFARKAAAVVDESFHIRRENEALVRKLEIANQAKTRFLAAASHDLRQPLHALSLNASLLTHEPHSPDTPQIAQQVSMSIESLAELLDSLLDISKLDAGVVNVQERSIRLDRLIANVVLELRPHANAKGIVLRAEGAKAVVKADPMLLQRILRNLIDNAIKYTDTGEVVVCIEGGEDLLISVRDTGRGIAEAELEKVFEEFFQVDNPERDRKRGLGLGLAIVRRLGLLLDLDIRIDSELGKGTIVSFRIPRAEEIRDEIAPVAGEAEDLKGVKVLVLDDEEAVRGAMRATLERIGCRTLEAATTDAALALSQTDAPDIVLADYRLREGETGIEAIHKIRHSRPRLPALLISGDTDPARSLEAERSGLVMLHKPLTMSRLRMAIAAALEGGAMQS